MKRLLLTMAVCLLGFSLSARSDLEDFPGNYYPDTAGRLSLFSPTLHLPSQNLTQDSLNIDYTYWFDEDYAHRQQGSLNNGHLLINASTLADGIHTLYMQLGYGTTAQLESFMFYSYHTPPELMQDSFNMDYTYWFDEDYAHRQQGNLGNGHLLIDASTLTDGIHALYMQLGYGANARLEKFMFYSHHTPPELSQDSFSIDYIYWFDEDYAHRQQGSLSNGNLMIDASALTEGFHALYMQLGHGTTAQLESFLFYSYHTPQELTQDSFSIDYTYWFDEDYAQRQQGSLSYGDLMIDASALTEGFHTVYMQLGHGTDARLEKYIFYIPPERFYEEYTDMVYWFGDDTTVHRFSPIAGTHLIAVPEMACGEESLIHMMAIDSNGNTSPVLNHTFIKTDSACCLPPLFATADHVTESGARLHWDYNRPQTFTLVYDTVPINDPNVGHNRVTLTDTVYWFTNMPSGIICYYAIKSECGNRWTLGEWNTRCRTLTPLYAEACDSYTWQGTTYTSSVTLPEFIPATTGGCDSVTVMHIIINHSTTGIETVSACDSYTWHDSTHTASTFNSQFSTLNSAGCDSVTTLHLTISQSAITNEYVTVCDSYTWQGTTYTASTIDTIATANAYGCDSIAILHLTINNSNTGIETVSACDSYTWHGTAYTASTSSPTFTSTNSAGCDSVTTLHLTVNHSTSGTETVTACDSYTWNGTTYTISSIDSITSTNSAGCDSVTTLHLTINYSTSATETVTACDSYTWHDSTYTASTLNSQFSTLNSAGCDSVTTLHLTINYSTSATETVTACDSYTWNGTTYTISSIDSITSTNAAGCDSVTTLHLTINYSTRDTIVETATNSYTWNGNTYTESGEYLFEGQTEAGCDSIIVLQLTITQVGINIAEGNNITLYPNPTSGKITIVADDVEKVEVFDQSGRIAATFKDTNEIDIHDLPTGAYTLRITLHNGSAVKRAIKQ